MLEYRLNKQDEEELQEYLSSIKSYSPLVYTELDNLLHNPTSDNQQKIIHGSLKMVANYTTKLYQELKHYFILPYSLMDFIQTGNEVLIKMVYEKKHDNYHNFIWAFYMALRRNIIKNHLPISCHVVDKYLDFLNKRDEFLKKYQHDATEYEMIKEYGYGERGIKYLNNYLAQNQTTNKVLNCEMITDGIDYIPELVHYLSVRETIIDVLNNLNLTDRYYEILVKYYGLTTDRHNGDNISMTPSELNEEYTFNSRQRIHQIIKIIIDRIRNDEESMQKLIKCKEITF